MLVSKPYSSTGKFVSGAGKPRRLNVWATLAQMAALFHFHALSKRIKPIKSPLYCRQVLRGQSRIKYRLGHQARPHASLHRCRSYRMRATAIRDSAPPPKPRTLGRLSWCLPSFPRPFPSLDRLCGKSVCSPAGRRWTLPRYKNERIQRPCRLSVLTLHV